jgi:hypothetical protein
VGRMMDEGKEMMKMENTPCLLWPFAALWRLVTGVLKLTGRVLGVVVGFILLVAGVVISLTVIGAVVGIPLALVGFLLIIRSLF